MPVTDDDFAATVLTSAIFGAALPSVLSTPAIRQAWVANHKARAAAAQAGRPASAVLADPALSRWSVLERPAAPDGQPGGEDTSPLLTPLAVNENGYVLFNDGALYRPDSDDFLLPDGRIVGADGNITSVAGPEAQAPATQPAATETAPAAQPTGEAAPAAQTPTTVAPAGTPPESESPAQSGVRQRQNL